MKSLFLTLLGRFQAQLGNQPIPGFRTKATQALLIYLAAQPNEAHNRERLMTLLWPGMPQKSARANLRQTLYQLRQDIPVVKAKEGTAVTELVTANRQEIRLNPATDVDTDVIRFESLLNRTATHQHLDLMVCPNCRNDLESAVALYHDHFLLDFYLEDSNEFEDWAQARREHYRRRALDALEILTTIAVRQESYAEGQTFAERQLDIDNLRESAYRQLMELLSHSGRREEALAVYDQCRRTLLEELGMEPSARTSELYAKIMAGDLTPQPAVAQGVRGLELREEIGQGAYGVIYRAFQPSIGRDVAVKVIRRRYANNPEFIRRFETEAQTVACLEHPYIIPLYDYWRDPDGAYLVMRFIKEGSLETALKTGAWQPGRVLRLVDQIGSALSAAHLRGIVHRDIKPANILLDETGNAYLTDFGIAKELASAGIGEGRITSEGSIVGTLDYISPEQIQNEPVSPQTDIYSFGAVLYETLTGEKPFGDSSVANLLYSHLNQPIPQVSASRPDLPPGIDDVLQKATKKRPSERYETIHDMTAAFHQALDGGRPVDFKAAPLLIPAVADLYNPYKGLRAFQESDADDFFGRDALIERLVSRLTPAGNRFLALVGPSGSGKSSAIKAGLIPALRNNVIPGSDKWFVAEMVPGAHPLEELEQALRPLAVDPPPDLVRPMQRDLRGLLRTIRRVLPSEDGSGPKLLLIIDQFEELFTLVEEPERRTFFLDSLLTALNAPHSPLRLVITLRADFYDRPLKQPHWGQLLKDNTEIILPLNQAELTWAVREPARRVGVVLEEGLAETIVADVADQPGALPLLQYALTELFDLREDSRMTWDAYEEIGGVMSALGRRAEERFQQLDESGQAAARQLFLRLVTLGESTEDTRRRVLRPELQAMLFNRPLSSPMQQYDSMPGNGSIQEHNPLQFLDPAGSDPTSVLDAIIDGYGRVRLLTFDRDPQTREPTVEVAHEALLQEWPRLRSWLDESRSDIRMQRMLAQSAVEWQQAGQDESYLLRGARLEQFAGWAELSTVALTGDEQAYLDTALAARDERLAAEEARRQKELETARQLAKTEKARADEQSQAAGRLRQRAVLLGGALVIAAVLALAAFFFAQQSNQNAQTAENNAAEALLEASQRATAESIAIEEKQRAEEQRITAEEQALIAFSRELAAAALSNLETDPELSILLALEGLNIWHTSEAESALHQAIVASPLRRTFYNETVHSIFLTASLDGRIIYASGAGGGNAWDTTTGELLYSHPLPEGDWINVADFNPDGTLLAIPLEQYDEMGNDFPGEVTVVDAQTGQELVNFVAHEGWTQVARFSPDGSLLATESGDNTVKIWDVEATLATGTGQLIATFCCLDLFGFGLDFSPGNEYLAIPMGEGGLVVWEIATGERRLTLGPDIAGDAKYSPDGRYLVTAGTVGNIDVWDAVTGELLSRTIGHSGDGIVRVQFSADGDQLVSATRTGSPILWRFLPGGLGEIRTLPSPVGTVYGVAFSPDGQFLYTSEGWGNSGTIRTWDISPAGSAELAAIETHDGWGTGFKPMTGGSQLVTVGFDGTMRLWDTQSWVELRALQAHEGRIASVDVSPDGQKIVTASLDDATPRIWDANNWQQLFTLEGHELRLGAFNPGVFAGLFSPDGTRLVTGGADGTVRIWDAANGALLFTLVHTLPSECGGCRVNDVLYSPDGTLLASITGDRNGTIKLWDAADGQLLLTLANDTPRANGYTELHFSPDGQSISIGTLDDEFEMWQLPADPWQATDEGAVQLYQLQGGSGWNNGGAFSPDGQRIATARFNGLVEIREVATGELFLGLLHPTGGVHLAEFTPDGKRLMTSGFDGIFRIWALDLDELMALAQSRVTRTFTDEECQQYLHMDACPAEP